MSFSTFGLSPDLLRSITEQKFIHPYPIQQAAIPAILDGKDLLASAPTGTGKTASFVLPILEKCQKMTLKNRHVNVLVLVPTRELAVQIDTAFYTLGFYLTNKVKSLAVYGGVSINPQMIDLQGVNVLVATPGRLLELIESKATSLSEVRILVIDEADKMLTLGFKDEMDRLFKLLPVMRQTLLYSATLSTDLSTFQQGLVRNPLVINIEEQKSYFDIIQQTAYLVSEERKGPLLRYLIKHHNMKQVLVFASSVQRADAVVVKLNANGIQAEAIHGQKSQAARKANLRLFKIGKIRVLVATDLMGRGIDIEFLPWVINYELPRSPKDYVHRIGRTGRAENPGSAIALVTPEEEHHFYIIQKKMGKRVPLTDGDAINLQGF